MTQKKYKNKYRIQSHRLSGWDYSANGYYFITLVTQNRVCNLGGIVNDIMELSEFGKIIDHEWNKSFEIRKELFMGEYVVMPNHLHAIVVMNHSLMTDDNFCDRPPVETHGRASLPQPPSQPPSPRQQPFIRQPKSISSFIAGFKSSVNTKIDDFIDAKNLNIPKFNRNNHFFQPNYYDHIIRNKQEYQRIAQYIIDNPKKWVMDKLNGGVGNQVMEPMAEYTVGAGLKFAQNEVWMI